METELSNAKERSKPRAQVKYYECTVCKKGFSNAQALGGHTNIHRRDREKMVIRSFSDSDRLSVNASEAIRDSMSYYTLAPTAGTSDPACPWRRSELIDHGRKIPSAGGTSTTRGETMEELDLELRLGPQPTYKERAQPKELIRNWTL